MNLNILYDITINNMHKALVANEPEIAEIVGDDKEIVETIHKWIKDNIGADELIESTLDLTRIAEESYRASWNPDKAYGFILDLLPIIY